jgi:deoxycytidylate deaminase
MDISEVLKPYFKIALEEADKSPCYRRQYGAMIVYDWYGDIGEDSVSMEWNPWHLAANVRVTNQCKGGICIRHRISAGHGRNVELGAEIHAEQAALIKAGIHKMHSYFILVGKDSKSGKELLGDDCVPCHACSVMLKWAGYQFIYHKDDLGRIIAESIDDIIEREEKEVEWSGE